MASKTKKTQTIEELLKDAGFQTLEIPAPHVIHASGTADFGKSHAAFLQSAGKNVAFIDSRKFITVPNPVLIVHRRIVEDETPTGSEELETPNSEPAAAETKAVKPGTE